MQENQEVVGGVDGANVEVANLIWEKKIIDLVVWGERS